MNDRQQQVLLFGTDEHVRPAKQVRAGALRATIDAGALRALEIDGVELIRQIDFPVRDLNWASLSPRVIDDKLTETKSGFRYERKFSVANGDLECEVVFEATGDGTVIATGTATAIRDFETNRTGFTILHPIEGIAGKPVMVRHASGGETQTQMPDLIKPSQPLFDIIGLEFNVAGVALDIAFSGDVFEMEDQRNWTDASFKTYCRPLVDPFAFTIKKGETLRQSVTVKVAGQPASSSKKPAQAGLSLNPANIEPMPKLLLACQEGWLAENGELELIGQSGLDHFLLRVRPDNAAFLLDQIALHLEAKDSQFDLEIVLADHISATTQLESIAAACRRAGVAPKHVMALPEAFLLSYQPSSVWPDKLQPKDCVEAAKKAFPNARIGSGMLTNFTELNRCRPDQIESDYITHTNTATVHAADDASVMQTLETYDDIFRSARDIAGDRGYRLGLNTIGMRTNPYGADTTPNPKQHRITMAVADPRARGLCGAAWAVGVLAATQGHNIEALSLCGPTGPFGMISQPQDTLRQWYDDHPSAWVYPIYHVMRALAGAQSRIPVTGLPVGLVGVAVLLGQRTRLVVANVGTSAQRLELPSGKAAMLDCDSFANSTCEPRWLDRALKPQKSGSVSIAPYSILFCDVEGRG